MSPEIPQSTPTPTSSGPAIRTDVVDVYVFRRRRARGRIDPTGEVTGGDDVVELLQLRRSAHDTTSGGTLAGTWQCIMGHIEQGETAIECAWRELAEEVGVGRGNPHLLGFWALEQVHPYFLARSNAIMLSPRFVVEVATEWEPTLNEEHDAARWLRAADAEKQFMWPGQRASIREIRQEILKQGSIAEPMLRQWPAGS